MQKLSLNPLESGRVVKFQTQSYAEQALGVARS